MKPLVWVTGAGGLIGNAILEAAAKFAPEVAPRALTRDVVDLLNADAVTRLYEAERPQYIVHCAAISKSPACEANPKQARAVNIGATATLLDLAADIPFCFFSTDLVFNGAKGNYTEDDSPNPLSVYAATKAEGERIVAQHPQHLIIRTSLNGGASPTRDRGFNEEMQRAWREGRTLNLFTDEYRSPIAATVTARVVWEFVRLNAQGIYHVAGAERLSRFQIGQLVANKHPELKPQIRAGSLKDYQGPPRAPDTSLNCAKAQALLPFRLPGLSEWLAQPGNVL